MNKVIEENIKQALASTPRNGFMAELHLQSIKYADELVNITAREFCEGLELKLSYRTEFSKMRNLTTRLKSRWLRYQQIITAQFLLSFTNMAIKKTELYSSFSGSCDEQRMAKTRQVKQGMMQELLTGRTRLPFEKES